MSAPWCSRPPCLPPRTRARRQGGRRSTSSFRFPLRWYPPLRRRLASLVCLVCTRGRISRGMEDAEHAERDVADVLERGPLVPADRPAARRRVVLLRRRHRYDEELPGTCRVDFVLLPRREVHARH